jgi:hypothetical protein
MQLSPVSRGWQEKHAVRTYAARFLHFLPKTAASRAVLALSVQKWHKLMMCFHATSKGKILPVWSRTAYDEVMLHCARIGFKP